jgi:hypothetical protein
MHTTGRALTTCTDSAHPTREEPAPCVPPSGVKKPPPQTGVHTYPNGACVMRTTSWG